MDSGFGPNDEPAIPAQAGIPQRGAAPPLPSLARPPRPVIGAATHPSFRCLTPESIPHREPPPHSPSLAPPPVSSVIPVLDTGIRPLDVGRRGRAWIPAFAGMTEGGFLRE